MTPPAVPAPFYWRAEAWGPVLGCAALDPVAVHAFTTRGLALPDVGASRRAGVAVGVGEDAVVAVRQVHGRSAVVVRRGRAPAGDAEAGAAGVFDADVLVSDDPDRAVLVRVADCAPVLLADRRLGVVAAVHAGWRGTAAGAAASAVETMAREWGTRPADLVAAIGPAIGACCYEVGPDVVDAFAAAGHARHLIDRWFQARPPARGARGRPALRLDVPGANRDQLILAGVPEEQIHMSDLCTAMHLDLLTSYRAERDGAGRLAAVIRVRA